MRKRNNESKAASGIQTAARSVGRGGQMTKQAGNIAKTAGAMIAGRGGSFSHTSSSQHGFQISDAQSLSSTDTNHSTQERSSSFSENNMMNRTDQFTGGQSQSNHFGQSSSPDAGVLRSASEQPKNRLRPTLHHIQRILLVRLSNLSKEKIRVRPLHRAAQEI